MKVIIDIETTDKDFDMPWAIVPELRVRKEQSLRRDYPDLDLLWIKFADLMYELRTLKETSERYVDTSKELTILSKIADVKKATLKAKLFVLVFWDRGILFHYSPHLVYIPSYQSSPNFFLRGLYLAAFFQFCSFGITPRIPPSGSLQSPFMRGIR